MNIDIKIEKEAIKFARLLNSRKIKITETGNKIILYDPKTSKRLNVQRKHKPVTSQSTKFR